MEAENTYINAMKKREKANGSLGDQTTDFNSDSTDEYALLREQNYKALLDSQIQGSVARQNAMKQTQQITNANGFGNTGYASMAQSGINNTYLSALQSAQNNYAAQDQSISAQEQTAAKTTNDTNFNNFLTVLNSDAANSSDGMNQTLSSYGLLNNGNLIDEASFEKMGYSANDYNQLKAIYALKSSAYKANDAISNTTINGTGFNDYQTAKTNIVLNNGSKGSDVSDELNYLFNNYKTKGNGDVVKLQSGANDSTYTYMVYYNGKWYQTNPTLTNVSNATLIKAGKEVSKATSSSSSKAKSSSPYDNTTSSVQTPNMM